METRANYVAVGGFVLACVLGVVITMLWLAGVQYSQEFEYYETDFKGPVTGLGKGTSVLYNGIGVGRVFDLHFDPNDPQKVVVILQVQPGLNLRTDSQATIEPQGLTGGAAVEITGGKANSPLLEAQPGQRYAIINSKPSPAFTQLEESAQQLVQKLKVSADSLNDVLSPENRKNLSQILANLNVTVAALAKGSGDLNTTLHNLAITSGKLDPLIRDADSGMNKFGQFSSDADAFVKSPALADLSDITDNLKKLLASVTKLSDQLDREPTRILFGDRRKGYSPNEK